MLRLLFGIVKRGSALFLYAMHVFGVCASSSPLGYLCTKFCFCRGLHCWTSPWRKIAYSITQSLIRLIWCPRNWSDTLENFLGILELELSNCRKVGWLQQKISSNNNSDKININTVLIIVTTGSVILLKAGNFKKFTSVSPGKITP